MNNSVDKVRLRITSPTLDESDDFSSINGGTGHASGSQRLNREDSPTER